MYPSREADRFQVRMPSGMRPKIAALAKANHRSMNNEIVFHLAKVLEDKVEAVAGESLQAEPATVPNSTALAGGPITQAVEMPR